MPISWEEQEKKKIKELMETASKAEQMMWLLANAFPQDENDFRSHIYSDDMNPTIANVVDAIFYGAEAPDGWEIYVPMIKSAYIPYFLEVTPEKDVKWKSSIITASDKEIPGKKNIPATISLMCGSCSRSMQVFLVDDCIE